MYIENMVVSGYLNLLEELDDQSHNEANDGKGVDETHCQDHHGTNGANSVGVTADCSDSGSSNQTDTNGRKASRDRVR
jgi:hypothetical protein